MEVILQAKDVPLDLLEYFEPVELGQTKNVFVINPGSYPGSHFATFPPKLVEPMIKAGTSQRGCCPKCLSPWVRVTSVTRPEPHVPDGKFLGNEPNTRYEPSASGYLGTHNGKPTVTTTGWIPTCSCDAGEPVPCTVLDPFLGSGTTSAVADFLGRHSVGIELSKTYCDDHIIPRLSEPLFEWAEQERAEQEQCEPEPVVEQMGLL